MEGAFEDEIEEKVNKDMVRRHLFVESFYSS
jgi:hypothetical protein